MLHHEMNFLYRKTYCLSLKIQKLLLLQLPAFILIDKHWIINHHKQIFFFKNTYCVSLEIQRILSFEFPVPWLISRNGTLCVHPVIMTLKMTLNTIISTMTKYKSINFIYLWKIVKNIAVSYDLWHSVAQECSK